MLTFHQGGTIMDGTTTPPALRTPAEGVWRHTAANTYAFRMKSFTFNAQNVFTGWSIIAGELTVDETGDAFGGPPRSRSMTQTASCFQLFVLTLVARDSSCDETWDLVRSIRAKPSNTGNAPNEWAAPAPFDCAQSKLGYALRSFLRSGDVFRVLVCAVAVQ